MKHLRGSKACSTAQRTATVSLLLLALTLDAGSASAACVIINTPTMLSGKLTVVGSAALSKLGRHLHAAPIMAQFAFKCDANTAYSLMVTDGAGGPATSTILRDERGNQVLMAIKLRSVDAKSVNLDFTKMPSAGYSDVAIAGKSHQVALEMTPADTAIASAGAIAKNFAGSLKISLQY